MHDVRQCLDKITSWQQYGVPESLTDSEMTLHQQFTLNVPIILSILSLNSKK